MAFTYLFNNYCKLNVDVVQVLEAVDAFNYPLPGTNLNSLGQLHNKIDVHVVGNCGYRDHRVRMTLEEAKAKLDSIRKENEAIDAYNQRMLEQMRECCRSGDREAANRIEERMKIPIYTDDLEHAIDIAQRKGDTYVEYEVSNSISGFYTRINNGTKGLVTLEKSSVIEYIVPTYIHEMMHAYFDESLAGDMNDAEYVEEPLAEYGMLHFLQAFVAVNPQYQDILITALSRVRTKMGRLGIIHYGFGAYLFENFQHIHWEELLHNAHTLVGSNKQPYYANLKQCFEGANFPVGKEGDAIGNLCATLLS